MVSFSHRDITKSMNVGCFPRKSPLSILKDDIVSVNILSIQLMTLSQTQRNISRRLGIPFVYRGCGFGRHSGYTREIRHRAWQISTGSWWCKMHWRLWQKGGSPGPPHFWYISAKNNPPYRPFEANTQLLLAYYS